MKAGSFQSFLLAIHFSNREDKSTPAESFLAEQHMF